MYESSRGESGGGISPPPPSEPGVKNSTKTKSSSRGREKSVWDGPWFMGVSCSSMISQIKYFRLARFSFSTPEELPRVSE